MWSGGWAPYVPVAERLRRGEAKIKKMLKNGQKPEPVKPEGRKIATTFWGEKWCQNLERYSDYANRLPRGRTYLRNGSVVDLKIAKGRVESYVAGSELYRVEIAIASLTPQLWTHIKSACAGKIDSMMELLTGKLAHGVMEIITAKGSGLFPVPGEIKLKCSCPDSASMCKHVAATLYGVGTRLDSEPTLFFTLRGVDHSELVIAATKSLKSAGAKKAPVVAEEDIGDLFGIDLDDRVLGASAAKGRAKRHKDQVAAAGKKVKAPKRAVVGVKKGDAAGLLAKKSVRAGKSGLKKKPVVKKKAAVKKRAATSP